MNPHVDVVIDAPQWADAFDAEQLALACVNAVMTRGRQLSLPTSEVCLVFTSDSRMRELNLRWRMIDKPTNVLSFPAPANPGSPIAALGDVFLGFETIAREAKTQGKTIRDHAAHMIVHGFLHLIGYDHQTDGQADEMESEEIAILAMIGMNNPYEGEWRPENAG